MSRKSVRKPGYSAEHESWFIPLTQGVIALVDADMVPILAQHNWYARQDKYSWYARRNGARTKSGRQVVPMHRTIMAPPDGMVIDHRHHRELSARLVDNRRANLRVCTIAQNNMNSRPYRGGVSQYKGVSLSRPSNMWQAQIRANGTPTHLGFFTNEDDAARAYDEAAAKWFGSFAVLNFPRGEGCREHG